MPMYQFTEYWSSSWGLLLLGILLPPPSSSKVEKRYGLNRSINVKSQEVFWAGFLRHFTCQSSKLVCMSRSFLGEALTSSDCHFSLLKAGSECPFVWLLTSTLSCSSTSPPAHAQTDLLSVKHLRMQTLKFVWQTTTGYKTNENVPLTDLQLH